MNAYAPDSPATPWRQPAYAAPAVPTQRRGTPPAGRPAYPGSVLVDIDAGVLEASRRHPRLSIADLREEHVRGVTALLLEARYDDGASRDVALRAEALVEHLLTTASPAVLTAHADRVGRLLRALHPDARADVLARAGDVGSPMRTLLERCRHAGDRTARAYGSDWC